MGVMCRFSCRRRDPLTRSCYEPNLEQRGILTTAQHVARSTTACMLDDLASEQCSICSTASWASNARYARQRARRAMLDMLDNELGEQCSTCSTASLANKGNLL